MLKDHPLYIDACIALFRLLPWAPEHMLHGHERPQLTESELSYIEVAWELMHKAPHVGICRKSVAVSVAASEPCVEEVASE